MGYPYAKFGDSTFSRFGFIAWTDRHTQTQVIIILLYSRDYLLPLSCAFTLLLRTPRIVLADIDKPGKIMWVKLCDSMFNIMQIIMQNNVTLYTSSIFPENIVNQYYSRRKIVLFIWNHTAISHCYQILCGSDAWSCLATWPRRTSLKIILVLYKPAYRPLQGTGGGVQVVQDIPG